MADIIDPTVIGFANDKIRVLSDHLVGIKDGLDTSKIQWVDTILGLIAANTNADVVLDGSEADTRTPLTKGDLTAIAGAMNALIAALDAAGVMSALVKAHSNPRNPLGGV